MPTSALLLALTAAFVHALWNLLLARAGDPEAATAIALAVGVVAFAPVAAVAWDLEGRVWPFAAASGGLELLYFSLLAAAYRRAELSVVYPVARGVAPVLVLIVGVAALGASTSAAQAAGVCLVGIGVLLVAGFRLQRTAKGLAFGLGIAACIATYTLVDKHGIRYAGPFTYLELTMVVPTIAYAAAIAAAKGGRALRSEVRTATVVAGLAVFGAYALVLAALQRAPAASVAAVRELSVVIAAALAGVVLRERVGRERMAGAVLVAGGIALISL
jgi:drug/metabolite transporter (DMT)-like permease